MDTLESIAGQLDTTREIQSIVRVMKSLSAVSITQYETAVDALTAYRDTIDKGMQVVLQDYRIREGHLPPRLFPDASGREGWIVIGSDRGLCGRFNETIASFAQSRLDNREEPPMLCVAGLRAAARLKTSGLDADKLLTLPGSVEGLIETAQSILIEVERWRDREGVRRVHVAYNRRGEQSRADPRAIQILPVSQEDLLRLADAPWPGSSLPSFSMAPDALLSWLVRQRMFLEVYEALAQSLASEHAARLAAMQAADRNIEERREDIESLYRQKRQEAITRELLDVVAGFEASGANE